MRIRVVPRKDMTEGKRLRVSAYVRVSSESEELENSLDNQKRHYEQYIASHPGWEMGTIYADFGISGFVDARPQFQQMLEDAREKKFDLLIVKSVSRLARNTETLLRATRELKSLGIGVLFELQQINTLSGSGELMLTVRSSFSQAESEAASATSKQWIRRKFKRGIPYAATARTYGYEADGWGGLRIREREAAVVRQIYEMAARGVFQTKIKVYLDNNGIPAPGGGAWNDKAIARILSNPTYKGDLLLQKTYTDHRRVVRRNEGEVDGWCVVDNHPNIVSPERWAAVQEIRQRRTQRLQSEKKRPATKRYTRGHYPLSNLLYCPHCGEKMIHYWSNGVREYWVCRTNNKVSAAACKGVWLPADAAADWDIREPVTVVEYEDEYGMKRFTCYPRDEFMSLGKPEEREDQFIGESN